MCEMYSDPSFQELNELIQNLTKERDQYNEYKILLEVIFDSTKSTSKLNSDLRNKLYNILMAHDIVDCLDLNLKETSLLGVDVSNHQTPLTYDEKEALKTVVQNSLVQKSRKLSKDLDDMGITIPTTKSIKTSLPLQLTPEEKVCVELKQSLNEKHTLYVDKLQELLEIYESINTLRSQKLPELSSKVAGDCEVRMEVLHFKTEMLQMRDRVAVFREEDDSLEYYRIVLKDIVEQQEKCKADIERLKVMKEKYRQVNSKEYEEILHSYLKYKCGVELKKGLVNPLTMK